MNIYMSYLVPQVAGKNLLLLFDKLLYYSFLHCLTIVIINADVTINSIVAAMCAIKTPTELLRDICVNTVSTDYMLNGEMKRQGVSWFPSIYKMGETWMKSGVLMDSKEFFRCCEFYYSNITFEEAYEMTGKSVCITVSASRAYAGSGVQRLLLNHISTPHVTLSSAVAASCSLPGAMKPTKLMMKNSNGEQVQIGRAHV